MRNQVKYRLRKLQVSEKFNFFEEPSNLNDTKLMRAVGIHARRRRDCRGRGSIISDDFPHVSCKGRGRFIRISCERHSQPSNSSSELHYQQLHISSTMRSLKTRSRGRSKSSDRIRIRNRIRTSTSMVTTHYQPTAQRQQQDKKKRTRTQNCLVCLEQHKKVA